MFTRDDYAVCSVNIKLISLSPEQNIITLSLSNNSNTELIVLLLQKKGPLKFHSFEPYKQTHSESADRNVVSPLS